MKAMILAAGLGTRLQPLTHTVPKPLVPVMNRPILEHTLALLRARGICEVIVNLYHLPEQIAEYFGDGSKFGVNLQYSREAIILGTAGGIKAAQKFLDGDAFLVINSDILTDIDLDKVMVFHRQKRSALTLVMRQAADPDKYAPIEIDADGRVVRFPRAALAAPAGPVTRLMFTGIQIMEPEIFQRIPPDRFCGTTEEIFPKMLEEGVSVFGYRHTGYWSDIGDRESYLRTHKDILAGKIKIAVRGMMNPQSPAVTPPVFIGKDCELSLQARIGPSVVFGDGCRAQAGATVEGSVCWQGVTIGAGAIVRDSILGAGSTVEKNAKVISTVVEK